MRKLKSERMNGVVRYHEAKCFLIIHYKMQHNEAFDLRTKGKSSVPIRKCTPLTLPVCHKVSIFVALLCELQKQLLN